MCIYISGRQNNTLPPSKLRRQPNPWKLTVISHGKGPWLACLGGDRAGILDDPVGPNLTTGGLKSRGWVPGWSQGDIKMRERNQRQMEGPPAKEQLETGKCKKKKKNRISRKRCTWYWPLQIRPVRPGSDPWLPDSKRRNFCGLKPLKS